MASDKGTRVKKLKSQLTKELRAAHIIVEGQNPGKEIEINKPHMTIGRENGSAEIVIQDAEISRRHAAITVKNEHFYLEDLGSTNGTQVNGQDISEVQLGHGDTIA